MTSETTINVWGERLVDACEIPQDQKDGCPMSWDQAPFFKTGDSNFCHTHECCPVFWTWYIDSNIINDTCRLFLTIATWPMKSSFYMATHGGFTLLFWPLHFRCRTYPSLAIIVVKHIRFSPRTMALLMASKPSWAWWLKLPFYL